MAERTINIASQRFHPNQALVVQGKTQVLLRAILLAAAAGIALVFLSGCTAQAISQAEDQLAARRAESLEGWETATLDGRPMLKVLGLRTALVWRDTEFVSAGFDESGLWMEASGENVGMAAAAAISRDGYLLTAGHVVADAEKLDVVVVIPDENRRVTQAAAVPARIVWMSEDDFGRNWDPDNPKFPLDFAIIHVDVAPLVPFKLADELPRTDEPVIGAGWGMRDVEVLENWGELAAGNVLSVHQQEPRGSSPAWTAVLHDIPLLRGDSGGPVLDREGNLVGISGAVVFRPGVLRVLAMHLGRAPRNFEDFGYSVVAYMPDPDWIREVIEKDRLQRNAGSATSDPQAQGELR